jgi:hypothetical protein
MKLPWFNRTKFGFFPAAPVGWIIALATAAYCIYLFVEIDSHSHSVSDTLISWAINVAIINILYSVFAFLTSRKPKL